MADPTDPATTDGQRESNADLLTELVAHLRNNRTQLRQEWARRIGEARLLTALTQEEIFSEATSVYDNYVEVLETGSVEALQDYARNLSERIIPRGVETDEVLGIVLLLRDVLARSLFQKYQTDFDYLNQVLDAYEPAANRIANTVGVNFVQERERVIRQQQEAIRELSTPVLQVRERLLILPIIGVLDGQRARQLTEQLLRGIRANRARVVVIDITGVPTIDSTVANHLVQTVDASRLMGASVIITGLSPEIAQTLVTLGVDLSKVNAVGDLQGGIEEAERLLGYQVSMETPALDAVVRVVSGRTDPQAGAVPDRHHPGGADGLRRPAAARRRDGAGHAPPLARDHRRRHRARRHGLVRLAVAAGDLADDPAARGRDRDRRHPARCRLRDGPARDELRGRVDGARPRGGARAPPAAAEGEGGRRRWQMSATSR